MNSEDIVMQINNLLEEIKGECSSSPAHADMYMIQDIAKEIDELQQKLWDIES